MRYLWIDSLCIIQGDADDWVAEAGKMANVYANSFLNIAAASGKNSRGWLFPENGEGARTSKPFALQGEWAEKIGLYARIGVVDEDQRKAIPSGKPAPYYHWSNMKARLSAPLVGTRYCLSRLVSNVLMQLSRAWVLQERLLAPRTLYFHEQEMAWDCRSSVSYSEPLISSF